MISVELGDQVSWVAKIIQRSAIGVIRGVPVNESIQDIKWHCEVRGHRVRTVKKLGPTVASIQFDGPLPSQIMFPFSFGKQATKVEPFTPGPRHCMKCFSFGHMAFSCSKPLRCAKCGGENHLATNCPGRPPKCPNCGGPHGPLWKECSVNQEKKDQKKRMISERKKEEREVEREAVIGIFGEVYPRINSRDSVLGQEEGSRVDQGPEPVKEVELRILGKLEEILEKKLKSFESLLESMVCKVEERMLEKIESTIDKNVTIPDRNVEESLSACIDAALGEKFEGIVTKVFEKVFEQAPTRSLTTNQAKSLRGGQKGKK